MMIRKTLRIALNCFLCMILCHTAYAQVSITPYPNEVVIGKGTLDVSPGFRITGKSVYRQYLQNMLKTEFSIKIGQGIALKLTVRPNKDSDPEAYSLKVKKNAVEIEASNEAGVFYGIQSLKQLLLNSKQLPLLTVHDKPAFKWRSFMLDEARYFQGKETVKRLLDDMALLKMNRFHWHLTNATGWRIEIKSFPLLTELGARRDSSQVNDNGKKWKSTLSDHRPHEGFYTQADIREIIAYATERQIAIIPEISMPGHVAAAIASYPFLGTSKKKISVPTRFGIEQDVLDVSSPEVKDFVRKVLAEVSELFPSDYIHIGGDEVKYDHWKESSAISKYMTANGISNHYDLQVHFTNEVSKFVEEKLRKRVIGWNEILGRNVHEWAKEDNAQATLSKSAIVQFWKGNAEDLLFGIEKGHKIINSDHRYTYLDYTYKQIDLAKAYGFNPIPQGVSNEGGKAIIGLGAQMWGEWTPTVKEVEYQTYPRIAAYAETGWTGEQNKNYQRFQKNLYVLLNYWKRLGYNLPQEY